MYWLLIAKIIVGIVVELVVCMYVRFAKIDDDHRRRRRRRREKEKGKEKTKLVAMEEAEQNLNKEENRGKKVAVFQIASTATIININISHLAEPDFLSNLT